MTKDEALRLALDAFGEIDWSNNSQWQSDRAKEAIACLRLVIDAENISSKPMAWEQFYPEMGKPKLVEVQDGGCKHCTDGCPACDARKLPKQEPVAWGVFEGNLHDMFFSQEEAQKMADLKGTHAEVRPLYTTPPQRTWVGLTDKELEEFSEAELGAYDLCLEVEAKLKEKNT